MSRELDEQIARALGYETLWADGGFGVTLYLHDSGAVRESPNVTANCRVLGARWEPLRVNGEVREYHVRYAPAWSERHEDARMLEDEIERRGLIAQGRYAMFLMNSILPGRRHLDLLQLHWHFIRTTPEQRARAFLAAISEDDYAGDD